MLPIKHLPLFDIVKVEKLYSKKDGVPVKYVCTSATNRSANFAADIFYRATPHPEFGNRYFGLYRNSYAGEAEIMITNADVIESLEFEMIEIGGELHYSQHRHDFHTVGDVSIDGGREYLRLVGNVNVPRKTLKIKDGIFVNEDQKG